MTAGQLVDVTDAIKDGSVGGVLSKKHTIRAVFRDFVSLPNQWGESVESATLSCHGLKWSVLLYPGGRIPTSSSDTVYVSIYLKCIDAAVKAKFRLAVPSCGRAIGATQSFSPNGNGGLWGFKNFVSRVSVLDPSTNILVDGNLTVEADIQVWPDCAPTWTPKTTLHRDFLKVLSSAKQSGDVKFHVGGEEFPAHRHVLEARAPTLAALAEGYPKDTPIPIQNVDASAFRALLHFVYADDVPKPEQLQQEARELLDVSDRYGCTGLKLVAEAELAASGITDETAADMILLGDAKNCALLKEAAIDFFANNPAPVMASSGWAKVKESASLLAELMEVVTIGKKRSAPGDSDERDYKRMCVSDLRRELDEKGLDVDGSRTMLLNRLENEGGDGDVDDSSHEDN